MSICRRQVERFMVNPEESSNIFNYRTNIIIEDMISTIEMNGYSVFRFN